MLSESEYKQLLPHKERLLTCNASHQQLTIIEPILQRLGYSSICYDCSGSVANAIRNINELMEEYEKNKQLSTNG